MCRRVIQALPNKPPWAQIWTKTVTPNRFSWLSSSILSLISRVMSQTERSQALSRKWRISNSQGGKSPNSATNNHQRELATPILSTHSFRGFSILSRESPSRVKELPHAASPKTQEYSAIWSTLDLDTHHYCSNPTSLMIWLYYPVTKTWLSTVSTTIPSSTRYTYSEGILRFCRNSLGSYWTGSVVKTQLSHTIMSF